MTKGAICDCTRGIYSTTDLTLAVSNTVMFSPSGVSVANCLKCGNRFLLVQKEEGGRSYIARYRVPGLEFDAEVDRIKKEQWDDRFEPKKAEVASE